MVALWLPNAASESLEKKEVCVHLSRSSWPRTPGPATAFPNLILVQTMVALWVPDAASESLDLEKKKKFVSICLGHLAPNTWSRHGFSQSNSGPKRASHGRTLDA